ncbi:MAG: oxidoreductase [Halobacteriales archaeon SW_8_66_22]|nr:MAG: oxidoreductase [Halobacteriales archaeon SW_8_66_22]
MAEIATLPEWAALAPALTFAAAAFLLLLADAVSPEEGNPVLLAGLSLSGALVSLAFTVWYIVAGTGQPGEGDPSSAGAIDLFDGTLVVDGMSLFFSAIIASVVVLVVLASYDYLHDHPYQAEYYSLVLLAATGMTTVTAANSFATAFIAIELVSLPSYALVASLKHNRGSVEAGLKYFLIGALSSAIFAYGISLVYVTAGSLQFDAVTSVVEGGELGGIFGLGVLMILGGISFKIAAVPFHFWAPEAYEGAPAPISAFISSASKAAGFVLLFRVFVGVFTWEFVEPTIDWVIAIQVLAIVTMTVANFAALKQEKVKRMLAYSSVGHAGYVLIALAGLTAGADHAFVLGSGMTHLLVYGFMNTGAFLYVALAEYWGVGRRIEDYNGLGARAPFASAAMTVFLFSLAGLPIGGGFLSKYYLLLASIEGEVALLAIALILNSVVSLYYYTRVLWAIWAENPSADLEIEQYPTGLYTAIALAALVTVLLLPAFGPVADLANTAAEMII